MKLHLYATLLSLSLSAANAAAQDLLPKAAPQTHPILVRHADIHTVSHGRIEDGELYFEGGRIRAIGRSHEVVDADAEGRAEVIDARGKRVYPGFVCVATNLGLSEIGSVDMTIDTAEAGSINPNAFAAVAVNPDSWLIPVTRRNGVLTCGVLPQGGLVSGRLAVLRLDGWTWMDMAIEEDAGLVVNWPFLGSGPAGRFGGRRRAGGEEEQPSGDPLARLDLVVDTAAAYLRARAADPSIPTDLRHEAFAAALAGEKPLFVSATTAEQIESAVTWAARRNLRIVIVGGRDAERCADLLARHQVPVVLTGVHRMPHRRDISYASTYELPAKLEAAGVRWCLSLSGRDSSNARNLPYEAAAAIAYGLDPEVALRSITLSAAECLGVGDRLGSLEPGKLATFFIADGDPFELSTTIEAAFIDGRRIDLRDKQTELAAKYREKYRQLGLIEKD